MIPRRGPSVVAPSLLLTLAMIPMIVSACGSAADPCNGKVAIVAGNAVTQAQFHRLLAYTLNYYEYGDPASPYYRKRICSPTATSAACRAVKRNLQARMIDQQIVEGYARKHKLLPSLSDWTVAKEQEQLLIRKLGGQARFSRYLRKLGVSQFQVIESLQIETRKTQRAIGSQFRFKQWLTHQRAAIKPITCSLKGV